MEIFPHPPGLTQYQILGMARPPEIMEFFAEVPSLHGCISQGNTRTEALRNVQEAITSYLES